MAEPYKPPGIEYINRPARRKEMLVTAGPFAGWLAYEHPDGQWVSLRQAQPVDIDRVCAAYWPRDQRFNICRPMRENVPDSPGPGWMLTVCPKCGKECWRNPMEPPVLPENLIGVCTACSLRGPEIWNVPDRELPIQEPTE